MPIEPNTMREKTCVFCGKLVMLGEPRHWLGMGRYCHQTCDACPDCGAKASERNYCEHRDWGELGR